MTKFLSDDIEESTLIEKALALLEVVEERLIAENTSNVEKHKKNIEKIKAMRVEAANLTADLA